MVAVWEPFKLEYNSSEVLSKEVRDDNDHLRVRASYIPEKGSIIREGAL